MISGYIDSASIHGVIAALGYSKIDQWPPWTLWSATEVTSALINDPLFEVAPGPGSYAGDYGLMNHTMRSLALIVSRSKPELSSLIQARNRVKRWSGRHPSNIKRSYEEVRNDKSCDGWLDYTITNFLVEHAASLDGLFDPSFIPQLARILNCSENDLREVWNRSRDLNIVKQWVRERPNTDEFKLAIDTYILSALLRGRFHECVAEAADMQIIHHPIRYAILPEKKKSGVFIPTNTELCLTSIILAGALSEKKVEDRISLWAESVITAKKALKVGDIDLSQQDTSSMAESVAMDYAKRLDIRYYSRMTATYLDVLLSLVIDGFICFVLYSWTGVSPLVGLPFGPVLDAAIKHKTGKSLGDTVASSRYQSRTRLYDLAEAVPGRIRGRWG